MTLRVAFLSLLLLTSIGLWSVRSGAADHVRNKLAYADIIPQRDNLDDPSRADWLKIYDATDNDAPAGATILLGDSIALRAPFHGKCIVNRGIGGERSDQLLANLDRWPSIRRAKAVVLSVGTNDVWQDRPEPLARNVAALIDRIDAPVYLIAPIANLQGIPEASAALRRVCRAGCTFIDPVDGRANDDIHLSKRGYAAVAARAPVHCSRT